MSLPFPLASKVGLWKHIECAMKIQFNHLKISTGLIHRLVFLNSEMFSVYCGGRFESALHRDNVKIIFAMETPEALVSTGLGTPVSSSSQASAMLSNYDF